MGKYRSRVEIVADILEVALDGALKTHIMYKCNLSYKLLQQYLADTIEAGLISSKGSRKQYTTEKGEQFLEQFKAYVQHSEEVRARGCDYRAFSRRLEKEWNVGGRSEP